MKICPKCNNENKDTSKFCEECGTKLVAMPTTCPVCGTKLNDTQKFCPECGSNLLKDSDNTSVLGGALIGSGFAAESKRKKH